MHRRTALLVIWISLALSAAGAAGWGFLLLGERDLRAKHLVPPHRGAATTIAGMTLGLGLGGLMVGLAALMPSNRR
jgi:hypothetical protein